MGHELDHITDRATRRGYWHVELSGEGDGGYRIRSCRHQIMADGLSRAKAERLAASYNAARDDAASLAQHLRNPCRYLAGGHLALQRTAAT